MTDAPGVDIAALRVDIAHHYKAKTRRLISALCDDVEYWTGQCLNLEADLVAARELDQQRLESWSKTSRLWGNRFADLADAFETYASHSDTCHSYGLPDWNETSKKLKAQACSCGLDDVLKTIKTASS